MLLTIHSIRHSIAHCICIVPLSPPSRPSRHHIPIIRFRNVRAHSVILHSLPIHHPVQPGRPGSNRNRIPDMIPRTANVHWQRSPGFGTPLSRTLASALLLILLGFARTDSQTMLPPSFRTEQPQQLLVSSSSSSASEESSNFSLDNFAHALRIEKDQQDPSRLLNVFLPAQRDSGRFRQFIARVSDISVVDEPRSRDANRTFLASLVDSSVINVHGLSPGHKYQVAILGRRDAESLLIRDDQVLMDPVPLDFGGPGNWSAIQATQHNITMRAVKPERALQDTFRVEYHQLYPLKRFPILDVHDLQEQREVELYLGNLSPGRDYAISVTSLREELPSQPWRGIITTRPLRPANLRLTEVNASCVLFQWQLPAESGADRFKIAYGMLHGAQSMLKLETQFPEQQAQLCRQIVPGRVFIFAVIAEKGRQISEPATISHTVRPLPPTELALEPDFEGARFRVRVHLASAEQSHTDKCLVSVQSEEQSGRPEQATVPAQGQQCEAHFQLVPGRRYEISATAISGQTASTRVLRNRAVEPGFDFAAFGLTLREDENGDSLRLEWPQSEVARLRIADLWARIVGRDSHLHFSVQPLDGPGPASQRETGPTEPGPVLVDDVRQGECYKVLLYTVTASGIVSEQRFEQHIRTSAPRLDLAVGQLTATGANIQAFLFRSSKRVPTGGGGGGGGGGGPPLLAQCQLELSVTDSQSAQLLLERSVPLADQKSPSIALEGLRPWRKYTANAQVVCGAQSQAPCAPKVQRIERLEFRTEAAPPGPILNFSVRALNSYSAQLRWQAPEDPNGRISHYIVQIEPQPAVEGGELSEEELRPWTERVPQPEEAGGAGAEVQPDGSESLLPRGPLQLQKVVDGLAGGRRYRIEVWPVNEAGQGRGSGQMGLETPIAAPPRPGRAVQVLADTVRSQELSVRLEMGQLNERNGRLLKLALVVAEADENGQVAEEETDGDSGKENGTLPTWAMARRMAGRWPPFVALEAWPEQRTRRFGTGQLVQKVGVEAGCGDRPAETLCNGPLKPGAVYRLKLRLFTAPHLWADSLYSESVHLELPVGESAFGQALFLVFFVILSAGIGTALLVARHRRNKPKSSFCRAAATPYFHQPSAAAGADPQQQRNREGQWHALKMIMAERAADCLAKLGLDPDPTPSAAEKSGVDPTSSPHLQQQQRQQAGGNVLCGGNAQNQLLFSAPHHRRSKSLRERTGVDQRLERLPSGPPAGQRISTLPWTIVKGAQPTSRSRPVQISDFIEHVRLMSADSDFRFSEEYEDLRTVGLGQTCMAADVPANRAKNRFTNILPYDHSRVKLKPTDDDDGSDYVNASYIPGFNSRREFIAAQGPLPSTRDHFWRLVWEQQVPAIVALTKCIEKGRDKCHQYWPDNSQRSVLYADIEVTLLTESIEYEEFIIRELRLTNLAEPGQSPRTVHHLHYQAWPDFGVPDHPAGIVHFARLFRNKLPPSPANTPIIVHCSAGVGRSGTFIALDRLMQHIECGKAIDVFGTVYEMRLERCHMVQNEAQYIFIHHCLQFLLENFYPFLVTPSSQQEAAGGNPSSRPHVPFGSSISSPLGGGGMFSSSSNNNKDGGTQNPQQHQQSFTLPNGVWPVGNDNSRPKSGPAAWSTLNSPPKIQVNNQHQNDGFLEDDEGIVESGL